VALLLSVRPPPIVPGLDVGVLGLWPRALHLVGGVDGQAKDQAHVLRPTLRARCLEMGRDEISQEKRNPTAGGGRERRTRGQGLSSGTPFPADEVV